MLVPETPTSDQVLPESVVWYSNWPNNTQPSVDEVKIALSTEPLVGNDVTGCQDAPLSVLAYRPLCCVPTKVSPARGAATSDKLGGRLDDVFCCHVAPPSDVVYKESPTI